MCDSEFNIRVTIDDSQLLLSVIAIDTCARSCISMHWISIHACYYLITVFIAKCVAITTVDPHGDRLTSSQALPQHLLCTTRQ